jgi:hypothetical protein
MNSRVRAVINRFISTHNIDHNSWKNLAIFTARLHIDTAPLSIRVMFVGKPSKTPQKARELAEIFSLLFYRAEDRAACINAFFSPDEIWEQAIQLWRGVQHG